MHLGPEPCVGCMPVAELSSAQFNTSKLLKMAASLTSAESNNWDFSVLQKDHPQEHSARGPTFVNH